MQKILDYINTKSRNKIVFYNHEIPNLPVTNIGHELSNSIANLSTEKHFALKAQSILDKLLTNSITKHDYFGNIISICNLGILFEPELKINFNTLIDKHSKNVCLLIKWDGEIKNNKLYFLTKENGIEINIKNLSHIII